MDENRRQLLIREVVQMHEMQANDIELELLQKSSQSDTVDLVASEEEAVILYFRLRGIEKETGLTFIKLLDSAN